MDTPRNLPLQSFFVVFASALIFFVSTSAFCAVDPIAKLTGFGGTVLIRSQGSWAVEPKRNLPLYSNDKVVTKIGEATITFNDGAVGIIKNNSNLRIEEREEEGGILKKVRMIKRRLRLLLGNMNFSSGKGKAETTFETPTAVCGIRGTIFDLSIGADGQSHIQFTEGEAKFLIGDFITGMAHVAPDLANRNPAQRAVYVAKAAADQAKKAAQQAAAGNISQPQAALATAEASETAANEELIDATIMADNNPDPGVVKRAREDIKNILEKIKEAIKAKKKAIDDGADPSKTKKDEPGPDVEVEEEPSIQKDPASDV